MKGACGCENQTKPGGQLTEFHSRLVKNQGTHFILHSSFFIPHYNNQTSFLKRLIDGFRFIAYVQFVVNMMDVLFYRAGGDGKFCGNFFVQ
jgi:hypothetical protein